MVLQQRDWGAPSPFGTTQFLKDFNTVFKWLHSRMVATFSYKTQQKTTLIISKFKDISYKDELR